MSFIKAVMNRSLPVPNVEYVDVEHYDPGDDIKDPEALAFYHTRPKFKQTQGQEVSFPRASSLYDSCMRMHVIACKEKKKYYRTESISPNMSMIFEMGNAVHYLIQNTPVFFGSRRIGLWRCLACNKILYWGRPPTKKCPCCGASKEAIFYSEHMFNPAPPLYCGGHTDLWLHINGGKPRVLDVKTMKDDFFDSLKAPIAANEFQIQTYMLIAEHDKFLKTRVDTKSGYLFYVGKKIRQGGMPYKMFHVRQTEASRKSVMKILNAFKSGYDNYPNKLPDLLKDCAGKAFMSWKAKQCPCLTECTRFHEAGK